MLFSYSVERWPTEPDGKSVMPQQSGTNPRFLRSLSLLLVAVKVNSLKLQVFWHVMV